MENQVRVGVVACRKEDWCIRSGRPNSAWLSGHLPAIFRERVRSPVAQIHLWNSRLALLDCGQAEQHAGKPGTGAVIESGLRGVAGRVLVVAAILEEAPHGPDVAVKIAAEFDSVASVLPSRRCPGVRPSCPRHAWAWRQRCRRFPYNLVPRTRARPRLLAAESDALDSKLAHDVVHSVILRGAVHRKRETANDAVLTLLPRRCDSRKSPPAARDCRSSLRSREGFP